VSVRRLRHKRSRLHQRIYRAETFDFQQVTEGICGRVQVAEIGPDIRRSCGEVQWRAYYETKVRDVGDLKQRCLAWLGAKRDQ